MSEVSDRIKRIMDVALSVGLLVMSAPLWLVVAAAIRLLSPGAVLYAGTRIGLNGRPFRMYKFRTMRVGADQVGAGITGARDQRVTPIGRMLRDTKLDELPQLLNVLWGDMSLVGPRPEAPAYVALYDERQRQVLTVRPGVTGPSQLYYRHEQEMLTGDDVERQYVEDILPAKLEKDLLYVRDRTLGRDIYLLWLTAIRLIGRAPRADTNVERMADDDVSRIPE